MKGSVPEPAKHPSLWRSFVVYSASRLGLFAVFVVLAYVAGLRGLIVLLLPLLLSGLVSYFLLVHQRAAFASAVEARITRRQRRVSERTAREDAIADQLEQDHREQTRELG